MRNTIWFLIGLSLSLLVIPALCLAGGATAVSGSSSSAGAVAVGVGGSQSQTAATSATQSSSQSTTASPSAVLNQNITGVPTPGGLGRQIPEQIIAINPTIPAFFGPFVSGWKILDDLTSITKLTKTEADKLGGGTKCILKLKNNVKWETDTINILPQYERKNMPDPSGWIFCTANGETTIDIISDAAKLAMNAGATDLVLLKHKVEYSTSGWGVGVGFGYNHGNLHGSEKEYSNLAGGVAGLGYGKTKGNSEDGLVFGILRR